MVKVKPFWNRPDQKFVCVAMGITQSSIPPENTVAERGVSTYPKPVFTGLVNLLPETIFRRFQVLMWVISRGFYDDRVSMLLPTLPVQGAPATGTSWSLTALNGARGSIE